LVYRDAFALILDLDRKLAGLPLNHMLIDPTVRSVDTNLTALWVHDVQLEARLPAHVEGIDSTRVTLTQIDLLKAVRVDVPQRASAYRYVFTPPSSPLGSLWTHLPVTAS
jgi:hypothetical protein